MVGVNGSVGQGKSYFSREVTARLNARLKPREGQAITRSLDDYYLTRADRSKASFRAKGYNPEGISNRGPAGTHDVGRIQRDILLGWSGSQATSVLELPYRSTNASTIELRMDFGLTGKVGVLLFEGWFVGAPTDVDVEKTPVGLQAFRSARVKKIQADL